MPRAKKAKAGKKRKAEEEEPRVDEEEEPRVEEEEEPREEEESVDSREPLEIIGVAKEQLESRATVQDEWKVVRKSYLNRARETHPDKHNGDDKEFKALQDAWDTLKAAYHHKGGPPATFLNVNKLKRKAPKADYDARAAAFYATADGEELPHYQFMRAPSNRSTCVKSKQKIPLGAIRCSRLSKELGQYVQPHLVAHWRVPVSLWAGLPSWCRAVEVEADPAITEGGEGGGVLITKNEEDRLREVLSALEDMDEIAFTGWGALDAEGKEEIARHVMDPAHHAKARTKTQKEVVDAGGKIGQHNKQKKKKAKKETAPAAAAAIESIDLTDAKVAKGEEKSLALVTEKKKPAKAALPKGGTGGIAPNQFMGSSFVLTGVFDEVPGGVGLQRGKGGIKNWIQGHGGRVVGKKTNFVVVGDLPGMSKVSKGVSTPGCKLVSVQTLAEGLKQNDVEAVASANPVDISSLEW